MLESVRGISMSNAVIIGGGVAGIQAAMDLANHGVHAYIIEREPSIGGHMAMLDKTFPTNDCSMCILSPKMAEVSRHPNITTLTLAEVEKIEGTAGNFTVTVTKYPRYVNEAEIRCRSWCQKSHLQTACTGSPEPGCPRCIPLH